MTLTFKKGLADALPIFFGYLSVGFAFGILAYKFGHPFFSPALMSATHISGTGQFTVINFLHDGGGFWTVVLGVVVINLRYVLMALSVAQRLDPSVGFWQRLVIACGDTDEIVGMAVSQTEPLNCRYFLGLTVCSWLGWFGGTIAGSLPVIANALPKSLVNALGISLYAMFIAIVVPSARSSKPTLLCSVLAVVLGVALRIFPVHLDSGWIIMIAGVAAAAVAALFFPMRDDGRASK